jgi:hypothetical protein
MTKKTIWFTILVLIVISSSVYYAQKSKKQQRAKTNDQWQQLFNGKDLNGWEHLGPGGFTIENGLLKTEGCVIKVVYKTTSPASNSGVFVRIADKPKDEWFAVHHGYEVQILDKNDEFHSTGAIYSLSKVTSRAAKSTGEWNTMEITLKGPRILVSVNGTQVNDFDPKQPVPERTKEWEPERGPRPEVGYIGIQNHDDYAQNTNVYFKEISVRSL